jgi:hypothetical protein
VGAGVNDKSMYRQAIAGVTALNEDAEALKHNFLLRGFFKKRGYEDSADPTKDEIAQLPAGPPQKTISYEPKQIFDKPDSAKLKNAKLLDEAGHYSEATPFGLVVIVCSTGMKGDSSKDRKLTEARSFVMPNHLLEHFRLEDRRIKTLG